MTGRMEAPQEQGTSIPAAIVDELRDGLAMYDRMSDRALRAVNEAVDLSQLVDGLQLRLMADRMFNRVLYKAEGASLALNQDRDAVWDEHLVGAS